jgi:hypothetical protein
MAHKRLKRRSIGLFASPDRSNGDDEVGVLGGPADDSGVLGVLGGPGHSSGLFDAPDRAPGEMPGLFDRPGRAASDSPGLAERPARAAGGGLFDRRAPRRK